MDKDSLPDKSDEGLPVSHEEAYAFACFKREHSNLARCYLDLRGSTPSHVATPAQGETPRTEAAIATWHSDPVDEQRDKVEDFARQLERELAEAQSQLRDVTSECRGLHALIDGGYEQPSSIGTHPLAGRLESVAKTLDAEGYGAGAEWVREAIVALSAIATQEWKPKFFGLDASKSESWTACTCGKSTRQGQVECNTPDCPLVKSKHAFTTRTTDGETKSG